MNPPSTIDRRDSEAEQDASDDVTALWVQARAVYDTRDFPEYASPAWRALPPNSPQRLAGVLEAAEKWRRYVAQLDDDTLTPGEWYAHTFGDARAQAARLCHALGKMRTFQEMRNARARPRPARPVRASPGWPPIAVPGEPGVQRHLINGQQTDLHDALQETAA